MMLLIQYWITDQFPWFDALNNESFSQGPEGLPPTQRSSGAMLPASLHPATWCLTNERLLPMKKLAIVSNQIGKMNVPMITWRPRGPRLKLKHSARFVFYVKIKVASGAQGKLLIAKMQNRKSKCSYALNHSFESLKYCRNTLGANENV